MHKTRLILVWALAVTFTAAAFGQSPAGTAFTYQGQLKLNSTPVNNTADFVFKLFAAASGGTQISADLPVAGVTVSKGLFTVQLDFGASAFGGDTRWLEIWVRSPAGGGSYTQLSPRQELTAAPYSLCAASAAPNAITSTMLASDADSLRKVSGDHLFSNPLSEFVGVYTQDQGWPECRFRIKATPVDGWGGMDITTIAPGTNPYYSYHDIGGYWASTWLSGQTGDWNLTMTGGVHALTVSQDGNFGIGTTTPDFPLTIAGSGNGWTGSAAIELINTTPSTGRRFCIGSSSEGLFQVGDMSAGGTTRMVVDGDGNVGIGTLSPGCRLDVNGGATLAVHGSSTATSGHGGFFECSGVGGYGLWGAATAATGDGTGLVGTSAAPGGTGVEGWTQATSGANMGGYFLAQGGNDTKGVYAEATNTGNVANYGGWFNANGSADYTTGVYGYATAHSANTTYGGRFYSDASFGVGVYAKGGASGFAADLDGTTRTKILQITGGADLAEPFVVSSDGETRPRSNEAVEPGMVVVIDSDRPGQLKLATTVYDQKVAGVISGANGVQPGMVMSGLNNAATDGDSSAEHAVALTGRVWCWCDAAHGSIQPGDRLTTSETPGHAMKVSDSGRAAGAVVGKAMTALPAGRGLVLVLVQPQ